MTTNSHTPTPWTDENPYQDGSFSNVYDANGEQVLQVQPLVGLKGQAQIDYRRAMAKQIAREHNNHAALVEALEKIRDYDPLKENPAHAGREDWKADIASLKKIDALALAKGE